MAEITLIYGSQEILVEINENCTLEHLKNYVEYVFNVKIEDIYVDDIKESELSLYAIYDLKIKTGSKILFYSKLREIRRRANFVLVNIEINGITISAKILRHGFYRRVVREIKETFRITDFKLYRIIDGYNIDFNERSVIYDNQTLHVKI